jgi:hypothetical protein
VGDPRFRDPAAHDYTLLAGSPAIDKGAKLPDREYTGSAPDLGAAEYAP